MPPIDPNDMKEAIKEALKEWLDEQFLLWGKWSLGALMAAGFVAFIYFILSMNGWRH